MPVPTAKTDADLRERRASAADTARLFGTVVAPFVAVGPIARRRRMMGLAEKLQSDAAVVGAVPRLRDRYGEGPLPMSVPGRALAIVLSSRDVDRILRTETHAFTAANKEKVAALSPFQPRGVLISRGDIRAQRRALNESALEPEHALHHLAGELTPIIEVEAQTLVRHAACRGEVAAPDFVRAWWRLVRRITFGDAARDDTTLTDELWTLRSNGNWSFAHPVRHRLRDRFGERLHRSVADAPSTSLAGVIRDLPAPASVDAVGQIPHWLFAFDAAGMVAARTLAVLSTHPEQRARVAAEQAAAAPGAPRTLDYLRGCVLEATRLWPTTPVILRDSVTETTWEDSKGSYTIPAGTAFVILSSAFHRADDLPFADTFEPEIWLDGRAEQYPQLVPFSAGPTACPGRNIVLFAVSTFLSRLLDDAEFTLVSDVKPDPGAPLPVTFDNFGLRFAVQ
ncbi:cytochrome P450 [Rhodococcus chondri]|uniref:Cytochrome P450 n=1 Tax=Rhodococcus chondri TaxID=3065941 RepID=A0ABU7JKU6_9NOCA|nr:cytochrome P450 [Rhodococcus sp. CC-R104]MEE2030663.1 cytochrome P450 [Rhodococcus sp. CC-R104]